MAYRDVRLVADVETWTKVPSNDGMLSVHSRMPLYISTDNLVRQDTPLGRPRLRRAESRITREKLWHVEPRSVEFRTAREDGVMPSMSKREAKVKVEASQPLTAFVL